MQTVRGSWFIRRPALTTLVLATLVASATVALFPAPPAWSLPGLAESSSPLTRISDAVGRILPLGPLGSRASLASELWVVMLSAAVAWCGCHLFRGPSRHMAAFAASPLTAAAVSSWSTSQPVPPIDELAFAVLSVLAVSIFVRPLVQLGRLTPTAAARALFAACCAALILPRPGLPLVLAMATFCVIRTGRPNRLRGAAKKTEDVAVPRDWLIGCLPALTFTGAVLFLRGGLEPPSFLEFRLAPPPFSQLREHMAPVLLFPACALVGLLVRPLRWRGGLLLVTLLAAAMVIHEHQAPIVPLPALLAGLALGACGWIWLAASLLPKRRWQGRALGVVALSAVLGFGLEGLGDRLAQRSSARPEQVGFVAGEYLRALSVPGDLLMAHDQQLAHELLHAQETEGVRPDVLVVEPDTLMSAIPEETRPRWLSQGRRLVSDSFDLGGRWAPSWAIEIGPIFWFVFDPETASSHTVASALPPFADWPPEQRRRWARVQLEHARFRRATGRELDAFSMLPLPTDQRRALRASAQVARAVRLTADRTTELQFPAGFNPGDATSAALAEAGDMLYESGDHELGAALLRDAATEGYRPAWGALARWQLRAGEEQAATDVLERLATRPELRNQALEVLAWLAERQKTSAAMELRQKLDPGGGSIEEVGVRLRLLSQLADQP